LFKFYGKLEKYYITS